jgi:hypothetical protein
MRTGRLDSAEGAAQLAAIDEAMRSGRPILVLTDMAEDPVSQRTHAAWDTRIHPVLPLICPQHAGREEAERVSVATESASLLGVWSIAASHPSLLS